MPPSGVIQDAVDEAVWYHGRDPSRWPLLVHRGLRARGIRPSMVTEERLLAAQRRANAERDRRVREHNHDSTWPGADREVVMQRLERHLDWMSPGDNAGGFDNHESEETIMTTLLRVRERDLREAVEALGLGGNDQARWPLKKLAKKVSGADAFAALLDLKKEEPEGEALALIKNIADALGDGDGVEVVPDSDAGTSSGDDEDEETTMHETNGHGNAVKEPKSKGGKKAGKAPAKSAKAAPAKAKRGGAGGPSLLDTAAAVLKASKKPMKLDAIFEAVLKKGWTPGAGKTPRATLGAAIYTEIKKKGDESRFQKADRGEFVYNG